MGGSPIAHDRTDLVPQVHRKRERGTLADAVHEHSFRLYPMHSSLQSRNIVNVSRSCEHLRLRGREAHPLLRVPPAIPPADGVDEHLIRLR